MADTSGFCEDVARATGTTAEAVRAGLKDGSYVTCEWCELPVSKTSAKGTFNEPEKSLCEDCRDKHWEAFVSLMEEAEPSEATESVPSLDTA